MTNISYLEDTGEKFRTVIHVLHEESQDEYKKILNLLKLKAIEKKGKDKTWVKYYNFVRRYADVNYSYSISCHKSQGSTYKNVFVLDDDIEANYHIEERNRIKYTAYTRASEKLYILKRITDI
jgi:ATP-dependent exoDNAse (exonuclease V) alpha subunit